MMRPQKSPFRRTGERTFRLVLDDETLDDSWERELLVDMGKQPGVEMYSTTGLLGDLLSFKVREEQPDVLIIEAGPHRTASLGADHLRLWAEDFDRDGDAAYATARRDLWLAAACREIECDALVTSSPLLLEMAPRPIVRGGKPMNAVGGLAHLGLYLRLSGQQIPIRDGVTIMLGPAHFYDYLARDLMPQWPRCMKAGVLHERSARDDALRFLAHATHYRLYQALRARDQILGQVVAGLQGDSREQAHYHLDVMLLMCAAVFDGVARSAAIVYELPKGSRPSWRHSEFRKRLRRDAPELASLMDDERPQRDVLEIVAHLRNQIHEAALHGATFVDRAVPGSAADVRFLVPTGAADAFRQCLQRLGGATRWGGVEVQLDNEGARTIALAFARFADVLITEVAAAANKLLGALDLEQLEGVTAHGLEPDGGQGWADYSPEMSPKLRVAAGLPPER